MRRKNIIFVMPRTSKNELSRAKECALQKLFKNIIIVGQCFAFLPVNGVKKENLRFEWLSFKTIYTCVTIILHIIYILVLVLFTEVAFDNFFSLVVVVWNVKSLISLLMLLKLGYHWPRLIRKWDVFESDMLNYGDMPSLKCTFKVLPIIFILTGTCEHLIFIGGAVKKVISNMKENDSFLPKYFQSVYSEIFDAFKYTHWAAVLIEFLALVSTFGWQYVDLLIVLLSTALAERFKQLRRVVKNYKSIQQWEWQKIRRQCNRLVELSEIVGNSISGMVLLSVVANIYFLSIFIFQAFTPRDAYGTFYFWYNLIFWIFHLFVLCIYGARVNEESSKLVLELHNVPSHNMPFEGFTVLQQMSSIHTAIHACKLFTISKSIILDVTSTIVTVQLILYQFDLKINSNV